VSTGVDVLSEPDRLRGTLTPLRQRLLAELREPASASGLAARLGESRQRLNYHLREMERGGLVELVEERRRRGRTERVLRATSGAVIVAPTVAGDPGPPGQDRFAVDSLLTATARAFNDVALMRDRARRAGKRLVTFTIEAEIGFERPADIERFAALLADRVAELAASFDTPQGRRYRLLIGAHPARPAEPAQDPPAADAARRSET
jgi:DNA-binding transcriptional ArsR family regulator